MSNPDESYDIRLKTTRSLDLGLKSIRFVDNVEVRFCFVATHTFLEKMVENGLKVAGRSAELRGVTRSYAELRGVTRDRFSQGDFDPFFTNFPKN